MKKILILLFSSLSILLFSQSFKLDPRKPYFQDSIKVGKSVITPNMPEFYTGLDSAKIMAALNASDIVKFSKTYTKSIIGDLTVPANKTLDFTSGGDLTQYNGDINFNDTKIINPNNKTIFSPTTTITGTIVTDKVHSDWMGLSGTDDETTTLQALIDFTSLTTGKTLELADGEYTFTGLDITDEINIKGQGTGNTTLTTTLTGNHVIRIRGTLGSDISLTNNVDLNDTILSVSSGANFSRGDYVYLTSKDTIRNVSGQYKGEICQIIAISGRGNILDLSTRVADSYTTAYAAKVNKINFIENVNISDLTIKNSSGHLNSFGITLDYCLNPRITNVNIDSCFYAALSLYTVRGGVFTGLNFTENLNTGTGYAISIANATDYTDFYSCRGQRSRHFITFGSNSLGGRQRYISINNCYAEGWRLGSGVVYDTHPSAQYVTFNNCTARYGRAGFSHRGDNITINNCKTYQSVFGLTYEIGGDSLVVNNFQAYNCNTSGIFFESNTKGGSAVINGATLIGNTIGVLFQDNSNNIVLRDIMISGGTNGVQFDDKETNNVFIDGCIIKDIKGAGGHAFYFKDGTNTDDDLSHHIRVNDFQIINKVGIYSFDGWNDISFSNGYIRSDNYGFLLGHSYRWNIRDIDFDSTMNPIKSLAVTTDSLVDYDISNIKYTGAAYTIGVYANFYNSTITNCHFKDLKWAVRLKEGTMVGNNKIMFNTFTNCNDDFDVGPNSLNYIFGNTFDGPIDYYGADPGQYYFEFDGGYIIDNLKIKPQSSSPSSPTEGLIYSNSIDHHLYFYNGSTWVQLDN